jgi:uncharacterized protein (DUF305 family)
MEVVSWVASKSDSKIILKGDTKMASKCKSVNTIFWHRSWVVLLLVAVLFTGTSATPHGNGTRSHGVSRSVHEIRFMKQMIDHHNMAVMMAEECLKKATQEELRSVCTQIIDTQNQEIKTLQEWLAEWYSISYAPRMDQQSQTEIEHLSMLQGSEFDKMFMEMMINHHWAAILMSVDIVKRARHKEIRDMALDIVEAQTGEIRQMREWLCQWYKTCDYIPGTEGMKNM